MAPAMEGRRPFSAAKDETSALFGQTSDRSGWVSRVDLIFRLIRMARHRAMHRPRSHARTSYSSSAQFPGNRELQFCLRSRKSSLPHLRNTFTKYLLFLSTCCKVFTSTTRTSRGSSRTSVHERNAVGACLDLWRHLSEGPGSIRSRTTAKDLQFISSSIATSSFSLPDRLCSSIVSCDTSAFNLPNRLGGSAGWQVQFVIEE